jgi:hypothetical protein
MQRLYARIWGLTPSVLASTDEICDCILKLLEVKAFLRREALGK